MKPLLKSYLIIAGHIIAGLFILVLFQQIKLPFWLNASVVIFCVFLLLNLMDYYVFKLNAETKEFWSLKKMHYVLWGILGGLLIALIPTLLQLIMGKILLADIHFNSDISVTAIILTFFIVGWEELWFRGLFLNYCNRYLSAINLSITIGLLFMLIHLLNPDINLIKQGPGLFFAGALLTILYFYYKTIWLPIGLHFGNNFFAARIKTGTQNDVLFGEDGYMAAIILATLFVIFLSKTKRSNA